MRPAAAACAAACVILAAPAGAQATRPQHEVAGARKVISAGHVDIGPRFVDGRWTLLIHDGGARGRWRHAGQTVLHVTDDAIRRVPDDPAYAFLGPPPGRDVHVVPQTEDRDVVWIGWNTQDPEVIERIDRGVTMKLLGVEGPGELVVYLQSGDFGGPELLWDSSDEAEPIWVDVNTHTHANWVFSAPGVYLAQVEIAADLVDGTTVADVRELRFAVGSSTSTDEAFAAAWQAPPVASAADAAPVEEPARGSPRALLGTLAVAVLLAGVLTTVALRGRRAKQRARAGGGR